MVEKMNHFRNVTLTRYHPGCRLCHYAGFSNVCTFSQGGKCPYSTYADDISMNIEAEQDDQ